MRPGTAVSLPRLGCRVWQSFDAAQRRECALVVLASVVAGGLTVIGVAGIAPFFAALADPGAIDGYVALAWARRVFAFESAGDFLVALGIGFVAAVVLANAANLFALLAISRFTQRAVARFHVLLFEEYLHRPLGFHARHHGDVLASHVVQEVSRTAGGVIQSGLTLIASGVAIALILTAVIVVDPVVAFAVLLALAASYSVVYALARRRLSRDGAAIAALWHRRSKVVAESFAAIEDVLVYRAQRELARQVARDSDAIATAQARAVAIAFTPKYVLECVAVAGVVAAALWIYERAGASQWLTQLAFLGFAAYRLLPPVQQVFAAVARLRSDGAGFERIADDLVRARRRGAQARASDGRTLRLLREIRLVGVSYRHSSGRPGGVHDISLVIPAGALVGLAGPNGSGKTTIANLLLGLLVPDAGAVQIDGIPLDDRDRESWLAAVAHVPQRVALLDASVAANVAFGLPRAAIDLERVRDAVRRARLEPVVDAMPDGLSTTIGANGTELSGGERQRLAIARALYRRAALLVLDEATSSLDPVAETEIIALLESLRGHCTTVLITHRLNALDGCDVVFEIEDGRLARARTSAGQRVGTRFLFAPTPISSEAPR